MKSKFLLLGATAILMSGAAFAENYQAGPDSQASVNLVSFTQTGDVISVAFDVNAKGVKMPSKLKTVFQPMLINENDTACFGNFAIDGKKRWAHEQGVNPIVFQGWGKEAGQPLTACPVQNDCCSLTPQGGSYLVSFSMPYNLWMGDAYLVLDVQNYSCTTCYPSEDAIDNQYFVLAQADFLPLVYEPEIQYLTPAAEAIKQRDMTSSAYLDFKVNQTTILPKYMNNPKEIAKMKATIDSIQNDADIKVTSMHIHGMASPEGPYDNNVKLAKGRTEALKNYLVKEYKVSKDFITTSWDPAINWEGLRAYLNSDEAKANSVLTNRAEILDIVNSDLGDFDRNQKIKTTYASQYNWLLKNVYPSLRVSEYTLNFEVRGYDSVEEILEVMQVAPNKLSVAELFEAGSSNGNDTELFAQAVQIAVDTYPNDQEANLNAGLLAMSNDNLEAAAKYLDKAGDSDKAKLARAQLDARNGKYDKALKVLKELEKSSDAQVAAAAAADAASVARIMKRMK